MPNDGVTGSQTRYRFADFEFLGESGELRRRGHDLQLPYQAGKVLHALLEAGGEIVTREQMRQALWPNRSYGDFDGGLNTAVCKLRQVLDDDGAEHRIIGTSPKRGYRLLVQVEQVLVPTAQGSDPSESRSSLSPGMQHQGLDPIPHPGQPGVDSGHPSDPYPASPRSIECDVPSERPREVPKDPRPSMRRALQVAAFAALLALVTGISMIGAMKGRDLNIQTRLWIHEGALPFRRLTGRSLRNSLGMEFVRIPAGSFTMGNDEWQRVMRPVHEVILTKPFLLQATEVTVGQFKAFVEATSYRTYAEFSEGAKVFKGPQSLAVGLSPWEKRPDANWRNPYYFQEDDCPVVAVDWNDIQTFIVWLNQVDPGKGYRLPTEAEWEYASRGSASEAWMTDPDDQAWHIGNSGSHAHPVGRRLPNAYGLHDMLGNVWEWCQDWYSVPFAGPFPCVDPAGPGEGDRKVIKGASWATTRTHVQWFNREGRYPEECYDNIGFRLAADAP